jgi:hypothetical protein
VEILGATGRCVGIQTGHVPGRYVGLRTLKSGSGVLRSSHQRQVEDLTMPGTWQKQPDQQRIVASLASECHLPIGEMATLYEHERADLALGAHVTKYLHIFAIRNVLEVLRQRKLDEQIPASDAGGAGDFSACQQLRSAIPRP